MDFILEEDRNSGHTSPITKQCKKDLKIKYFFNAAGSPDLSPMENAWRVPAIIIQSLPYNNRQDLVANAKKAWDNLDLETVNGFIDSMPDRFKAVLELKGKMTRF